MATNRGRSASSKITDDDEGGAKPASVVDLAEARHAADQDKARRKPAASKKDSTSSKAGAAGASTAGGISPGSVRTLPTQDPTMTKKAAAPPPSRGIPALLKNLDSIVDRFAGFVGRRIVDMAPGIAVGEIVHRVAGVRRQIAYPVGAATSQLIAAGVDYSLRDTTLAPEAAEARRAFERIVTALDRGVPHTLVLEDMRDAGWSADVADALLAKAQGLRGARAAAEG